MERELEQGLWAALARRANQDLLQKVATSLAFRTRHLCVVLEEIYQPHNGAAVLRACDAYGIQELHAIAARNCFQFNEKTSAGAQKWVNLTLHQGAHPTENCLAALKRAGYRIVATSLRPESIPLADLELATKTALCFGTEERGLTETAHQLADAFVALPMVGFTQSYNVSVSVALCLEQLTRRLHASGHGWRLSDREKSALELYWLFRALPRAGRELERHLKALGWDFTRAETATWPLREMLCEAGLMVADKTGPVAIS